MEYDFKALSDYDFELLVCDLLSAWLGRRVENFRRGRDGGVDLRYAEDSGGDVVVQCKHYANTPFSGLRSAVRAEREKVQRLHPKRYLLVTSRFLTPAEKDELLALLTPFCRSPEDILGGGEINTLLRLHPEVEQAHYKLWLTSAAVLEKVLHSEIYRQSVILQSEIQNKLRIYVQSKAAYGKARKMLNDFNCCIISGIPGIGKTTLAEILLICYLDKGYQIVKVRSDIGEALRAYQPERKQMFLYDDFLGSTSLEMKSNKNEGRELLSFMGYVSRQSGKKFVLTTREYILNQARQSDENFARENFDYKKCVISLEDYTRADRASILYNHLFFCGVSGEDIRDLLEDRRVIDIIDHPNYSPRLIETVIKLWRPGEGGGFYSFFAGMLDQPSQLWENAFCRQISPAARDLLLLLCPEDGPMYMTELERRYEAYHDHKSRAENRARHTRDFKDALKETEGTFIRIDPYCVTCHNPSVRDFIHGYIRENDVEYRLLCEGAADFNYCLSLAKLDPGLCGKYEELYAAALDRTAGEGPEDSCVLAGRVSALASVCRRLHSGAVQGVLRRLLEELLMLLEQRRLSEDTWNREAEPGDLKELLENLALSEYEPDFKERIFDVFFQYGLAWFEWAFSYEPEDFLLFQTLQRIRAFSVDRDAFQRVYEALTDFRDETAWSYIQDMDYEGQCDDYQWKVEDMEKFFHVDLSEVISGIDDRRWEIEESENEEDDDSWKEDLPSARDVEDQELLNMFQGLLERG